MNVKLITTLLVTTSMMVASPYAGLKLGFSKTQLNTKFSGTDEDTNVIPAVSVPFSFKQKMNTNSLAFGLLVGTTFKTSDKMSVLLEGDWEYLGGKAKKVNLDVTGGGDGDVLRRENIQVRAKHSFGFMPGLTFSFNEKLSGLFGLRFNMTQFHVRVFHQDTTGRQRPLNNQSKSKFLFGVEPTVGAAYKINDKMAARLTFGYNLMQSKKIVTNYTQDPAFPLTKPDVTLKPRGVNIRLATTYSF